MMPSLLNTNFVGVPQPGGYSTDLMLEELSRQLASANNRRLSRGSNGQRAGAMRIVKPSSANNSPRSSLQARRRTLMNDGLHGRMHHPVIEASYLPTPSNEYPLDVVVNDPVKRAARPVSWHPSSHHLAQPQQPSTQCPFPSYTGADLYSGLHNIPPTPAAYSGYTSPASAFSPLSLPYSNFDYQQYVSPANWTVSETEPVPAIQSASSSSLSSAELPSVTPAHAALTVQGTTLDWDSFVARGFDRCTAPPTPENLPQPQPQVKLPTDESIPFQSLEDDESDGEILYGMGLYDAPEKPLPDFHKSTIMSLWGGAETEPEPTGKGLKLEDAWEPPEKLEYENDDENDGDESGEGESDDQDE